MTKTGEGDDPWGNHRIGFEGATKIQRSEFGMDKMPEAVADTVIEALDEERFLVLPHPEVLEYMRRKTGDYDRWLGPAPERPFAKGRYHPGQWRRWWDFGNGMMGDRGAHTLDPVYWALKLGPPTRGG